MSVENVGSEEVLGGNTASVLKKLFIGSFVILFVGVCAFISLLFLMRFI